MFLRPLSRVSTKRGKAKPKARLARRLLASIAFTFAAQASMAENHWIPAPAEQRILPEALLLPLKMDGRPLPGGGWVLIYSNRLQGPEVADHALQFRRVTYSHSSAGPVTGAVTWEIRRTQNNLCRERTPDLCPDMLRVLSVPEGFVAVPEDALVDEGSSVRVLIVPAGVG